MTERLLTVSVDCHAGSMLIDWPPYLPAEYRDVYKAEREGLSFDTGSLHHDDDQYEKVYASHFDRGLSRHPSEYFATNVLVTAAAWLRDWEIRDDVGIDNEVAKILGLNTARLYGFDVEKLRPVTERVGPES